MTANGEAASRGGLERFCNVLSTLLDVDRAAQEDRCKSGQRQRDREDGKSKRDDHDPSPLVWPGIPAPTRATMLDADLRFCDRHHRKFETQISGPRSQRSECRTQGTRAT